MIEILDVKKIKELIEEFSKSEFLGILILETKEFKLVLKKENKKFREVKNSEKEEIKKNEIIVCSKYIGIIFIEKDIKEGKEVQKGERIAIAKSLGISNGIVSPCDGVIEKIFVKNKEKIDYNKPLFKIRIF